MLKDTSANAVDVVLSSVSKNAMKLYCTNWTQYGNWTGFLLDWTILVDKDADPDEVTILCEKAENFTDDIFEYYQFSVSFLQTACKRLWDGPSGKATSGALLSS